MLKQLHQPHPDITRIKSLARSYFWWPKKDSETENVVNSCVICQEKRHLPAAALLPKDWPEKPWRRIHLDNAGPLLGRTILIMVDAHSKWIETCPLKTIYLAATIECLKRSFSQFGLPKMVVSDNATCFTSGEFQEFVKKNGITHVTSAPYHAASNGLARRVVQTVKALLKKSTNGSLEAQQL